MNYFTRLTLCLLLFLGFTLGIYAQEENPQSDYNKLEAFNPQIGTDLTNSFHSTNGEPGPTYRQNQDNYKIKATLDTVNNKITGELTLTYINNSPYDLNFLWLQ